MRTITRIGLGCLGAAGVLCALIRPRRGNPGWEKLDGVKYAHRGMHDASLGIPENSMAAFRRAVEHGFGAELDIHLMADGNLAVVHDSNLRRVCGADVCIEDMTAAELGNYHLMGTGETIPLFQDVLELFRGKTPLVIELKVERGNYVQLTDAVMKVLEGWEGIYCVESFHPAVLLRLKEKYPAVLRGQLSQNFMKDSEVGNLTKPVRFILTHLLTTGLTCPDFISYKWEDRKEPSLRLMRALYGVHEVGWTVREKETMDELAKDGVTPIFERFIP